MIVFLKGKKKIHSFYCHDNWHHIVLHIKNMLSYIYKLSEISQKKKKKGGVIHSSLDCGIRKSSSNRVCYIDLYANILVNEMNTSLLQL